MIREVRPEKEKCEGHLSHGKMTFAFFEIVSSGGFEPPAFRLGVDRTSVNPLQNRVIYSTLYQ